MKALVRFVGLMMCVGLMATTASAQIASTATGGNWSSTGTWVGGVLPTSTDNVIIADGATVTIDQAVTVASLTIGQGSSGTLTFDGIAARAVTVTGDITIAAGGLFITQATGAYTNTLSIGGNLTNNGKLNLSRSGSSTLVCNVTFTKNGDQTITGTGSDTTMFRGITLAKTSVANRVIASVDVYMSGSGMFVFTAGTWEQTAGTLNITSGNQTVAAAGALKITGSGNFNMPGSSPTIAGSLTVNTTGTFLQGGGNNSTTINAGATLNLNAGTVTFNGRLTLLTGSTTVINGANITINQQVGTTLASSGNNGFDVQGTASLTFSSGTVTFGAPNAAGVTGTRSGQDLKFAATVTGSLVGGTFIMGDGNATPAADSTGYRISVPSPIVLDKLTINSGGANGRNSYLTSNLILNGTFTVISGKLMTAVAKTVTYGGSSTLLYAGTTPLVTGIELSANVNNLTVNNAAGVTLASSTSVSNVLTLTNGALTLAGNSITLNNPIVVTSGSVNTDNTSSIVIAGTVTGVNIPSSVSQLNNLTINNSNGTTLQGPLTVNGALTFTSGKITTGTNTLTLGSAATFSGVGAGVFAEGNVARVVSATGPLTWPTGLGADYLPVTVYVKTVTSPGALTMTVLDKGIVPYSGILNPATQELTHYIHTSGDQSLNIAVDSVAVSYLTGDLPANVFASDLQVLRWNGYPWLNTSARIDSVGYMLYPKQNIGGGDYVVTGAGGFISLSVTTINYGTVLGGQSKLDSVVVTNTGNRALSIDSVRSTLSEFTILPTSGSLLPGATDTFRITYAPLTAGSKFGSLLFYSNGLSALDTVHVSGGVEIFAGFSASPDSLDFGTVARNASKIDSVFVTNGGNTALVVDSIKSSDGSFAIVPTTASIAAGSSLKFTVTYHPTTIGAKAAIVQFYSNSSTQPDTVWVKGDVLLAPLFSASKTSMGFGTVLTGQSKTDSVTVKNPGTATLNISSVASTNAQFAVTPASGNVAMDDSMKFYVTFTPTSSGTQSAKIAFNHNASTKDTILATGNALTLGSVKAARLAANGTEVLFEAIVTRAKGNYTYVQDTSAGMNMYQSTGAWKDSVTSGGIRAGDKIRVDGRTSEYNSLKEIAAADLVSFTIISRNNTLPAPQQVTLKELATNGENYESELVKVIAVSVNAASATTYAAATTYAITDPSDSSGAVSLRIPNAGDSDVDGTTIIPIVTFTGVVGQYSSSNAAAGYQLMAINANDLTDNALSVNDAYSGIPQTYSLENNYPNPFNPSTTILYGLPQQSRVTVKVYSILGQEVRTLVDEMQNASFHRVQWNGRDNYGMQVSSGVYFFRINAVPLDGKTHPFTQVKKMLLMK